MALYKEERVRVDANTDDATVFCFDILKKIEDLKALGWYSIGTEIDDGDYEGSSYHLYLTGKRPFTADELINYNNQEVERLAKIEYTERIQLERLLAKYPAQVLTCV